MRDVFEKINENIKKHDEIIIMTHARPDLDGMGSALVLYKIVKSMNKPCYIVSPKEKIYRSLDKAMNLLYKNDIKFNLKTADEIINSKFSNPLLFVLDTQKPELVESERVLEYIKDKIVIDHHIGTLDTIDDAIYKYDDANKSSIAEVMAEYLKFLDLKIEPLIMTVLFAGMVVDTSSFSIKTTAHTFDMAAFFFFFGADFVLMQELLKEPKEEMTQRYVYINNSEEVLKDVLICKMDDKVHGNVDIALLAKELLKFEDVKASFAVGKLSHKIVGISARSMGEINVGEIMEKFGGGGHLTDAAAQIKDKTVDEVYTMLKNTIKDVIK